MILPILLTAQLSLLFNPPTVVVSVTKERHRDTVDVGRVVRETACPTLARLNLALPVPYQVLVLIPMGEGTYAFMGERYDGMLEKC